MKSKKFISVFSLLSIAICLNILHAKNEFNESVGETHIYSYSLRSQCYETVIECKVHLLDFMQLSNENVVFDGECLKNEGRNATSDCDDGAYLSAKIIPLKSEWQ